MKDGTLVSPDPLWVNCTGEGSVVNGVSDEVRELMKPKATSTLYGPDGEVKLEWIKSSVEKQDEAEAVNNAVKMIMKDIVPVDPVKPPESDMVDEDMVVFYPLPDLHLGLLIHSTESTHGYNYDVDIATAWITGAMDHLVDNSPKAKVCVIADLGDLLHAADNSARTTSGHQLDTDGRHAKIVKAAYDCIRRLIDKALEKHEEVKIYSVKGNHSEDSSIYLKGFLDAWYRNEPRVSIYMPHQAQQYYVFGKVILGFTHGHELRPKSGGNNGETVLLADNMDKISASEFRYMHFGHYHSNKVIEGPLVTQEIHKNIIPHDSWADSMGYRGSIGEAKAIYYHREFGEVGRSRFSIKMRPDLVEKARG